MRRHSSTRCMAFAISVPKSLSYAIILGSSFIKLPLLLRIVWARSGVGISFVALVCDLISTTLSASYAYRYGFPFISWGEYPFLMAVTLTIACLVLRYERNHWSATLFSLSYVSFTFVLINGCLSLPVLWSMQLANFPLAICGKLLQIATNYRNGHTGQLSAITAILVFGGTVIRVLTSIEETGDPIIVITLAANSCANLAIVGQIIYYWNQTNRFLELVDKERASKLDWCFYWCVDSLAIVVTTVLQHTIKLLIFSRKCWQVFESVSQSED